MVASLVASSAAQRRMVDTRPYLKSETTTIFRGGSTKLCPDSRSSSIWLVPTKCFVDSDVSTQGGRVSLGELSRAERCRTTP